MNLLAIFFGFGVVWYAMQMHRAEQSKLEEAVPLTATIVDIHSTTRRSHKSRRLQEVYGPIVHYFHPVTGESEHLAMPVESIDKKPDIGSFVDLVYLPSTGTVESASGGLGPVVVFLAGAAMTLIGFLSVVFDALG